MAGTKLIVVEPNMHSYPHSEINAGLLSIMQEVFPFSTKYFYVSSGHLNALQDFFDHKKWKVRNINVIPFTPWRIPLLDLILMFRLLFIYYKMHKDDHLILLGIYPLSNWVLSLLNRFSKRNVLICLHGQMESYLQNTTIGVSKHYYNLSKHVFKQKDYLRYIVFGQSIFNNVSFLFPDHSKAIIIDQPYVYDNESYGEILGAPPLNLGFLGRFDKTKNVQSAFNLFQAAKDLRDRGLVKISIIGRVSEEYIGKFDNDISFSSDSLPRDKFIEEVLKQNFIISFTGPSFYRATPSGVFFDCIKYGKPLIALRNEYLEYYFKKYCALGYLCDSVEEMYSIIKDLAENPQHLVDFQESFDTVRTELGLSKIAERLKEAL
ncbi:hypothetical protein ACFSQ3_03845 [Sphingobacterium corticis]|uniref:Uncharacterized protein n=1 Tax=Sphingobacterium corticis TaxID=1812823 RepID=A0ABW5NHC7_9SPHI